MVLEIFNTVGKRCYTQTLANKQDLISIDANIYENGLYLYRFTSETGIIKEGKFIVQK